MSRNPADQTIERHTPQLLAVLLLTFVILVLMYSVVTPLFEAPDEVWHYAYVRWLAEGHGLPSMRDDASGANQEVAQPPLYYGIAALLSAPFPDDDLDALFWGNPGFGYQSPGTTADNKNMLIHTAPERWPWQGAVLAIHITRLTSLLFGLLAVAATWGLGCETFGARWGTLTTAALVAFHPQFVFISSVVSNDSAAAALSTATLWIVAHALRRGITLRRTLVTGVLVGLAILTKTSALLLLPLAGAALFWAAIRDEGARLSWSPFKSLGLYGITALATGGWWYLRNFTLYGDPLGISNHVNTPWGRPEPVSLPQLLPEIPSLLRSFWGAYGWGHVTWPNWVYVALWAASLYFLLRSLSNLAHTASRALRKQVWGDTQGAAREPCHAVPILIIAALWCAGILAALLRWMQQVQAPHGRLLFPAIAAWSLLLANGMGRAGTGKSGRGDRSNATPSPARTSLLAPRSLFLMFLAILTALAPGARILASFAPPRLYAPDAVMKRLLPVDLCYAGQAELLGIAVDKTRAAPGETLAVRACWQALHPMAEDYTVFVHLIGPENSRVAERHTYPGLGRFPTSLWPVGRAFCDTYRVQIEPWAEVPIRYHLEIGLFDAETGRRLQADNPEGNPVEPPIVADVAVTSRDAVPVRPQQPSAAKLGDLIALRGYDAPATARPGETLTVTLHWEALAPPDDAFVAFVHLWRPGDPLPLAQHDSPPRLGWYPTTVWQQGDAVLDAHPLEIPADLPPGRYPLWAGLYRAADGTRLPAHGPEGRYPNDLIPLGELEIR